MFLSTVDRFSRIFNVFFFSNSFTCGAQSCKDDFASVFNQSDGHMKISLKKFF